MRLTDFSMTYDTLPTEDVLTRTVAALKEHGVEAFVVQDRAEALAKVKELIPTGVSLNNGTSRTLGDAPEVGHRGDVGGSVRWLS